MDYLTKVFNLGTVQPVSKLSAKSSMVKLFGEHINELKSVDLETLNEFRSSTIEKDTGNEYYQLYLSVRNNARPHLNFGQFEEIMLNAYNVNRGFENEPDPELMKDQAYVER